MVGLKLNDTEDLQQRYAAVKKQLDDSDVDVVVHNDLMEISDKAHPFYLYTLMQAPVPCKDVPALAKTLNELMETVA